MYHAPLRFGVYLSLEYVIAPDTGKKKFGRYKEYIFLYNVYMYLSIYKYTNIHTNIYVNNIHIMSNTVQCNSLESTGMKMYLLNKIVQSGSWRSPGSKEYEYLVHCAAMGIFINHSFHVITLKKK